MDEEQPRISDEISPEHVAKMNLVAKNVAAIFPNDGFALLVFELEGEGRMNWISNGTREDLISALKGFVAALESTQPGAGGGTMQ